MTPTSKRQVICLCGDLMWRSRIRSICSDLQYEFTRAEDRAELESLLNPDVAVVFVDLETTPDAPEAIRCARRYPVPAVGFGAHVHAEALEQAREAGAEVFPRGAFASKLPQIIRRLEETP